MNKMKSRIRPLDGFSNALDVEVVSRGTVVQTNMTGNSYFPFPPVDLAVLKAAIESLVALMAAAADGSKKVIAEKNEQREAVIRMLRMLGRYVEVTSKNDMSIFQTSGFEPASSTKVQSPPLSETIRRIEHGANSGQLVVWLKAFPQAYSYEFRYAALDKDGLPQTWTVQVVATVRPASILKELTPGRVYAFQARWLGKTGHTDWSDSVTFMCT
jgi:hypothetical protein